MIFPSAKIGAKRGKTLCYGLNFTPDCAATECSDVEFCKNVIRSARVFERVYGDEMIRRLLYASDKGLFIYCKTDIKLLNGKTATDVWNLNGRYPIGFTCYYDTILASSYDGFRFKDNYQDATYRRGEETQFVPRLSVCGSRLLGLKDDCLLLFDPTHEAQFYKDEKIRLPSYCSEIAVVNGDTAYLIGSTVYKLTVSENNCDVKLAKAAEGVGEVTADTVSAADGGRVIFASNNGLYRISSGRTERICKGLDGFVCDYSQVKGAYYDGLYYMSCRFKTSEGERDGTLVIDPQSGEIRQILGNAFKQFITGGGKLYALKDNGVYVLSSARAQYMRFLRRGVDLGAGGLKTVKSVSLRHTGRVYVDIVSEKGAVELYSEGGGREKRYRIGALSGKSFDIKIFCYGGAEVQLLTIEAGGKSV